MAANLPEPGSPGQAEPEDIPRPRSPAAVPMATGSAPGGRLRSRAHGSAHTRNFPPWRCAFLTVFLREARSLYKITDSQGGDGSAEEGGEAQAFYCGDSNQRCSRDRRGPPPPALQACPGLRLASPASQAGRLPHLSATGSRRGFLPFTGLSFLRFPRAEFLEFPGAQCPNAKGGTQGGSRAPWQG